MMSVLGVGRRRGLTQGSAPVKTDSPGTDTVNRDPEADERAHTQ
jgi:hypothetical protein